MALSSSLTKPPTADLGRGARITLWAVQIVLALMFVMAGGSKLVGADQMVQLFESIGIGQWFRYVTGLIEITAGILLLVPSVSVFAALLLVPTMIGAVLTQVFIVRQTAVPPAILLLASVAIVWVRRRELSAQEAPAFSR